MKKITKKDFNPKVQHLIETSSYRVLLRMRNNVKLFIKEGTATLQELEDINTAINWKGGNYRNLK